MKFLKNTAASLAAFTMVISPVAQGAEASAKARTVEYNYNVNKKSVQEFLKYTGLASKKKVTVGEFHAKMRPFYPATLRAQMDEWVQMNRNEIMPEFEASTYKDSDGKERVRLILTKDGQTVTASFNPDSNAKFLKVNNVYLTKDDLKYHEQGIRKIVHGNKAIKNAMTKTPPANRFKKSIALGYEEYSRLTAKQRAEYLVRVRYVLENAEKVMTAFYGEQAVNEIRRDFFVQWLLLGQDAEAQTKSKSKTKTKPASKSASKSIRGAVPGDPCIVSGYVSSYGNDYSCGGTGPGRKALIAEMEKWGGGRCTNGSVSCNPLVYGFKNGQPICVKNGRNQEIQLSTSQSCKNQSPLRKGTPYEQEDKKRIIESYLAQKDPELLKKLGTDGLTFVDGKVSQEQYDLIKAHLDTLNSYVQKAITTCGTLPLAKIKDIRDEQGSACSALALRKIELDAYPMAPIPAPPVVVPPPVAEVIDCSIELPNSELVDGKCVCRAGDEKGKIKEDDKERDACLPVTGVLVAAGDDTKEECNKDQKRDEETGECKAIAAACSWCKWLIGAAIFAGVAALIHYMTKDDDDHSSKPNPDPCPPAPLACLPPVTPGPSPTVTPPPVQPPPTTNPDPIPTPAVTPFVESTSGTSTSTTGGVR